MFHLPFGVSVSQDKIHLKDSIVSVGSCFAENIGRNLTDYKFQVLANPFGNIYNPLSLGQLLTDEIDAETTVEQKGVHYHWQAHGEVSALSKTALDELVKQRRTHLQNELATANWLIITLGSAFAYRLKSSGQIVANCHKVPQSEFTKELLAVDEMTAKLSGALHQLTDHNPKLRVILTVSPVRHIRDGLVKNNQSKARLIEVAHALTADMVSYFPAYEIIIDELRDYRFYAKDWVHPSEEAIDYIWSRFGETYFDDITRAFIKDWQQIRNAFQHKPFHPSSDEHQAFVRATIKKLNLLSEQVDVSAELSLLERQLS